MTDKNESVTECQTSQEVQSTKLNLVIAEYNALRAEILQRSGFRYQIIALTLATLGTLLTFGLQFNSSYSIFIYPILGYFLASIWAHNFIIRTYARRNS